mmetsp:Transcript_12225/g.29796  ORF Transcript_12225/g.29796 Transcript_12225/m.29796 type:complete len:468 (-) Transcript_12225:358-1761(-)
MASKAAKPPAGPSQPISSVKSGPAHGANPSDSDPLPLIGENKPNEEAVAEEMEAAYVSADQARLRHSSTSHSRQPSGGMAAAAGTAGAGTGGDATGHTHAQANLLQDTLNISHVLTDAAAAIVDDSFLKCFTSAAGDPWNWNAYLWPQWLFGMLFRHLILFPLRMAVLVLLNIAFLVMFFGVVGCFVKPGPRRKAAELRLVQFLCGSYMMSWNAVVRYHGPRPTPGANKVWVSNHTSMIDYVILCSHSPFSVIMQLHTGWVAFLQTRVLNTLGCLWFNRTDLKDRHIVADRMRQHVQNPASVPLLIFPEGTCVNNEYCVLFKRGAFDLGATVCPIAIKYNKVFVDAFWNSKRQTFGQHLMRLMSSWALVCDVWFLEPQSQRPGETPDEFAGRVQRMIADTAGLKVVPWDGYLKYYNLGQAKPALVEKRRKVFGDVLRQYLPPALGRRSHDEPAAAAPAPAPGAKKDN